MEPGGIGPTKEARRILIVRVGALGDTLMATPLVAALAESEPAARIDFLCSAGVAGALNAHPRLTRVHTLRQRNWPIFLSLEKQILIRTLRREGYDLAILLESARRYRELVERCGIREIRGFGEGPLDPLQHSSRNHLAVAGFPDWRELPLRPFFGFSSQERRRAEEWVADLPRPRIGIHCGYGPAGKKARPDRLKGWHLSNFTALGRKLLEEGASLVLTGSRGELPATRQIATGLSSPQVLNLAGATGIGELGALISGLDLFISVDSGPAHLAAVVGTPLIVLWGPAKWNQVHPLSNGAPVVDLRVPVPCAPCYDTPAMKSCRSNICMQLIRPQRVYQEATRILRERGERQFEPVPFSG